MREVLLSRACITPGVGFQDSSSHHTPSTNKLGSWESGIRRGCDSIFKSQIRPSSPKRAKRAVWRREPVAPTRTQDLKGSRVKGSGGYHPSRIPATWRRPTPRGVTLGAVGSPWSTRLTTPARDFARDCRRHPPRRRLAPPSSPTLSRKPRRRFYPPNPPRTPEE